MDFEALWLTLRLAVGTTAILLVLALPLAWWIASGRGVGRALVQSVVALPLLYLPNAPATTLLRLTAAPGITATGGGQRP